MKDHNLFADENSGMVLFTKKPCLDEKGMPAKGLFNAWITLNNPKQFNSYTTEMVKEVILAFRKASNDRSVVAVIFTGAGDKAFCTGGNTKEYAEYYSGNPQEYSQYMRLFNDMVTSILMCEKPVICRVNGMRIGGGQEIGMACDFSIAQDLARFGQAGPKHGSAPVGGATDFLHLYTGIERAMGSLTLCDPWSAHQAYAFGVITDIVPALKVNGEYIPNPMVITDRWTDPFGRIVLGTSKTGDELAAGKSLLASGALDLGALDETVNRLATRLLMTFPNCTMKTIGAVRQKKLEHWDKNKEANREWLALNMMTEAKAGFRAFNDGPKENREIDFILLRQQLAEGHEWNEDLHQMISPQYKTESAR